MEEEEGVVLHLLPWVVVEGVLLHLLPLVEEEGVVLHPPPMMEEEEGLVLHPPPMMEEEEEVVLQPPPMVEEEEGVVLHPLPLVVEEEGVGQELPDPDAFAQWVTMTLESAELCRDMVATEMDDVISRCENALLNLHEILAVLIEEPEDAAELLYANLLELVNPGLDSLLSLDPAAKLVDSLFNYPGPVAGAVDVAAVLVSDTFGFDSPLEAARGDLEYLVNVVHAHAGHLIDLYAAALGVEALPGGQAAFDFWVAIHDEAGDRARSAVQRLNFAVHTSRSAVIAVGLCRGPCASRVRTQAGMRAWAAVQMLQQTISEVFEVLLVLHGTRDTLVRLEQAVLNITGNGHGQDPPHP